MSDATDDLPELPPLDEPKTAADVERRPMPFGVRILGVVACLIVAAVFIAQVVAAFGDKNDKPLNTMNAQGENASIINQLALPVFAVAGVVFVLVMGAVLVIAFKYRERPGDDDEQFVKQTEGNTRYEIFWTLLPAVLLAVIGFFTVVTIQKLEKPTAGAIKIDVYGQQWWWGFRYHVDEAGELARSDGGDVRNFPANSDNDVITSNEIVVPVGTEVNLRETSNDVIHSYWIPNLNGKKDAVPGTYTYWKIQGEHTGVYLGQCTEYCGLSHANMRMVVRVVSQDEFDRWFQGQRQKARDLEKEPIPGNERATEGQKQFKQLLCSSCHLIRGINDTKVAGLDEVQGKPQPGVKDLLVSGRAPDLTHFASRGMFAGAIFNSHYPSKQNQVGTDTYRLYVPDGENPCTLATLEGCGNPRDVATPGDPANPFFKPAVGEWLRNPPKVKPMAPTEEENPYAGGKVRGMPNLGLSEDQITSLVAYLETLK